MLLQTLAVLALSQHVLAHIMMLAQCELIFRLLLKMTVGKNPSVHIFLEGQVPTPLMSCLKGGFAQAQHHRYQKLHCGDQAWPSSYQRSKRSAMQGPLVCRLPS